MKENLINNTQDNKDALIDKNFASQSGTIDLSNKR